MPEIVTTIELTDEEIKKGKAFFDQLLKDVYDAGAYQRERMDLTDYPTFDAAFEAFMLTLGLEV